jgi:septum site-determining protein MinC
MICDKLTRRANQLVTQRAPKLSIHVFRNLFRTRGWSIADFAVPQPFPFFDSISPADSPALHLASKACGPGRFVRKDLPCPAIKVCEPVAMDAVVRSKAKPIRMRGRSYVAFVFSPVVPIMEWLEEVDATLQQSPGFFAGKPVVLDLSAVDLSEHAIAQLVLSFEQRHLRILGFEGVDASRLPPSLPPLLGGGRSCTVAANQPKKPEAKPKPASLLIDGPVRSGQSIVFAEGDITIVGAVSSGAEIVAGGSIHVYGALRGRAMAGINGNLTARIYCQKVEAELLAIDGYYRTAEEIDAASYQGPMQVWLQGDVVQITPLN